MQEAKSPIKYSSAYLNKSINQKKRGNELKDRLTFAPRRLQVSLFHYVWSWAFILARLRRTITVSRTCHLPAWRNCGHSAVKARKKSSEAELRTPSLPFQVVVQASSHVAASLFRYEGRIVRIDCIRAQLLAFLPPPRDTHLRARKAHFADNGFYNLMIPPSVGWWLEY